jgi:organic radical activating enzyme
MKVPQIIWQISGGCTHECWYCLAQYRNNPYFKTTDEYLHVVDLLLNHGQRKNIPKVRWTFKGGEPLQFPNFNMVLKAVKQRPAEVCVETSGGESWFEVLENINLIDELVLTHHYWQNESVLEYIIDLCRDNNKKLKLYIPLQPGKMRESKDLVARYKEQGIDCEEQVLREQNWTMSSKYTLRDLNIYYGRPEDWEPPPPAPPPPPKPVDTSGPHAPPPVDPQWVDPRQGNGNPSYTGKSCYAGVDYLYIDSKGFAHGSDCGGRDIGNVFNPEWLPPDEPFACPMLFCHSENDRRNIRIIKD